MEETLNYDSHVWDYRRNVEPRCMHEVTGRCSWCAGVDDSKMDDTIEPGRILAWFTPAVEVQAKAEPQYSRRYNWSRSDGTSGVTVVPSWVVDDAPLPVTHNPNHVEPWVPYFDQYVLTVEYIDADDSQEIRVREAVRDFGLLTRHRDLKYATGIGLDYDAFVWGIVAPEHDTLAIEGASVDIDGLPMNVPQPTRRPVRSGLAGIRDWRRGR